MSGGNVVQGIGEVRMGGTNGDGLDYRVYGKGFIRGPEFHPMDRTLTIGKRANLVSGRIGT